MLLQKPKFTDSNFIMNTFTIKGFRMMRQMKKI